ncbi:cell invasion protein [Pseudomonas sp. PCH199]|uniref:cell invasion protein n=1 Tax=unclassified Pseudomonas TaxID=196821 RepID=UPI000BD40F47|nr:MULTISPECIES: cell invasion protein [unclassified Pseudomonas]MCW8277093.1 cell invasion protein [Pseudomonas sp. PCH199]PAM82591.1 cell invasion protein [Pseudomonas sp. ERMR1:02]
MTEITRVMSSRPMTSPQEAIPADKKLDVLKGFTGNIAQIDKQILKTADIRVPSAIEFERAIEAYQPDENGGQALLATSMTLSDEVRDLVFDPGAWEKHANVLVVAIIALNLARVANAAVRGHFSVLAADAAKSQGAAIVESGKAALNSAITAAVVSGAIAGFAMFKTFQGQGLKHADISLHKRDSLDANNIGNDLKHDRGRDDWNPQTTYKIKTFDDFGRSTSVDFKPSGSTLTAKEQAWFDGEILKAQKVAQTSDWLSQMGTKGIEKKLEIGRALNAMSMSMSQVVSSMVRISEHAAREQEVLQQSAQSTQKSLSDEVGQRDSAEAALLQKLMEMVMQLFQSRADVIRAISA